MKLEPAGRIVPNQTEPRGSNDTSLLEPYRGRGIGTALMQAMLAELADAGYAQASLSVQKRNPAVRLYKRLGFQTVGENDEEFILVRTLGPLPDGGR